MFLISKVLRLQTALCLFLVPVASETIAITPAFPEMHHMARISCYSIQDRLWYHNGKYKTTCNKEECMPSEDPSRRYTYTAGKDKTEVTISFLNRTLDRGVWTCEGNRKNNITLDVYSFPRGLSFIKGGETEGDLARAQVTLQCQTDGCTYPLPNIKWYYKDATALASPISYKETGTDQMKKDGICISPEQIYTSNLALPLHSTWHDNSNKSVTLSCGMDFLNSSRKIFSPVSKIITFAVAVSLVNLQHNNQPLSDTSYLNVTSGIPVNLTCVPGLSRPDPTIEWFIGLQMMSSGTSQTFTFTPENADDDKVIFCRAYNINRNRAVESQKTKLYVTVHVSTLKLQVNNQPVSEQSFLTVTSGETVTLTCVPGISRPDPIIEWYMGSVMKGASTSHTYTFTPSNEDHGDMIFCRAYSVDPSRAVESSKAKLYVKGLPQPVLRFYFNRMKEDQIELQFDPGFNGGYDQSFAIEYRSILIPDSTWESIKDLQERENQYQLPNGTFSVNVTQRSPGSYLYRMYSWNVKGKSPFSDSILITIPNAIEEKKNPGDQQVATIPVFVGMGAGTTVLIVTVIALVIVILRKRSYGSTPEPSEIPRYEIIRGVRTGGDNTISAEYESLRENDNPYLEIQDLSADSIGIDLRIESGRLILQSAGNNITSNVYDSPTGSKAEVHSYVEPEEATEERNETATSRSQVGRVIFQFPGNNATCYEYESPRSSQTVHSYFEPQDFRAGEEETITTRSEVGRQRIQTVGNDATFTEYTGSASDEAEVPSKLELKDLTASRREEDTARSVTHFSQ